MQRLDGTRKDERKKHRKCDWNESGMREIEQDDAMNGNQNPYRD
jgi:hypothetical protein